MTAFEPQNALPLKSGETRSLHLAPEEAVEIHVTTGACWVTLEGDREDYVVPQMESLLLEGPGLLVVQGLAPANDFAISRLVAT
jgi:hypothetical protein